MGPRDLIQKARESGVAPELVPYVRSIAVTSPKMLAERAAEYYIRHRSSALPTAVDYSGL